VLPTKAARSSSLLTPERAEQIERALCQTRSLAEDSAEHGAAEARLLELVDPFIDAAAHEAWTMFLPRTYLSRADLRQQGRLRAQKLWKGFTPGVAPGKTLYPAYVLRSVRQEFKRALTRARVVPLTDWGRKLVARTRKRMALDGLSRLEALAAEGADPATSFALSAPGYGDRAPTSAAAGVADETHLRHAELGEQLLAAEALEALPEQQRVAIAGALGFLREDGRAIADPVLARRLGCTVAELREAREAGLAALRQVLGEVPRCPLLPLSALGYAALAAALCVLASTPSSARRWGPATQNRSAAKRRPGTARIGRRAPAGAAKSCPPERAGSDSRRRHVKAGGGGRWTAPAARQYLFSSRAAKPARSRMTLAPHSH